MGKMDAELKRVLWFGGGWVGGVERDTERKKRGTDERRDVGVTARVVLLPS